MAPEKHHPKPASLFPDDDETILVAVDFRLLVNTFEQFAHMITQTRELFSFNQAPFNKETFFAFLDC